VTSANSGSQSASGQQLTISLHEGEDVDCTFINTQVGTFLSLVKRSVNELGTPAPVTSWTLSATKVGDGSPTLSGAGGASGPVSAGNYALAESGGPSGYEASGWSCINGTLNGSTVTVPAGKSVECTITNTAQAATLTLVKTVKNDNGGGLAAVDFPRFIDGIPVSWGVPVALDAGLHTATETAQAGYAASAWGGDCAANGTITLALGETKTCTITNDDIAPTLKLVKTVTNNNGGTLSANDFPRFIDGNAVSWNVAVPVTAGVVHTASETTKAGYTASPWGGDCAANGTITLSVGDAKICTITNADQPATLTIVKKVVRDDGGTKGANDFGITTSAGNLSFGGAVEAPANTFTYTATPLSGLPAGSKTLHEENIAGYTEGSWSCTGTAGAVNGNFNTGSVVLGNGESVTCTITNNDDPAKLTVVKRVVNDNGGTAGASAFGIQAAGNSVTFGSGAADGANTLKYTSNTQTLTPGLKNLVENNLTGYTEGSWTCVGAAGAVVGTFSAGSVVLANGEDVTCTITNDDIAPRLTLSKTVVSQFDGQGAVAASWTLGANGPTPVSGAGGVTNVAVNAGNYLLTESAGPSGYAPAAAGYNCVKNGAPGVNGNSIALAVGDVATCTIVNSGIDAAPSISLEKTASPKNLLQQGGVVTFTVKVTNTSGSLDPVTIESLSDSIYGNLAILTGEAGKKAQLTACLPALLGTSLAPGASATCTFTANFAAIGANETFSEKDTVRICAEDNDTPSAGVNEETCATDDAVVSQSPPIALTNSSLCSFDMNPNLPGRQWTRLFTQDAQSVPYFRLTATNPGQFFYNLSLSGTPGEVKEIEIELPYPFVTQSAAADSRV
jgi:hypothetical protein